MIDFKRIRPGQAALHTPGMLARILDLALLAEAVHVVPFVCRHWHSVCRREVTLNLDLDWSIAVRRNVPRWSSITDAGLWALTDRFHVVEGLNLARCRNVNDATLLEAGARFPQLVFLNLNHCEKVTDAGLLAVAKPHLLTLHLARLDLTYRSLSQIFVSCPKLVSLSLHRTRGVTDRCLVECALGCSQLGKLDLTACVMITKLGLSAITTGCKELAALNLSECRCVTDDCLVMISKECSTLQSLTLPSCDMVAAVAEKHFPESLLARPFCCGGQKRPGRKKICTFCAR